MKAKYYYISTSTKRVKALRYVDYIILYSQSRNEYEHWNESENETIAWFRISDNYSEIFKYLQEWIIKLSIIYAWSHSWDRYRR